jgi:hypothetical protein
MVDYRRLYLAPNDIMHSFTPTEFALCPKDPRHRHQLGLSFMKLAKWLVKDCLRVSWEPDEMQTALHNVSDARCQLCRDHCAHHRLRLVGVATQQQKD